MGTSLFIVSHRTESPFYSGDPEASKIRIFYCIVILYYKPVARGGSEELPSQRKVHFLKNKVHLLKQKVQITIITTLYRDVGIGQAGSAAARLRFHPQLKIVVINEANNKFNCGTMHVTVLMKYLHYYKLNITLKNKATNLLEQQFHSDLGTFKIKFCFNGMKLKNDVFICLLIS